eukprot:scaffold15995_cov120-Isochrysis_galbana.AAC.1
MCSASRRRPVGDTRNGGAVPSASSSASSLKSTPHQAGGSQPCLTGRATAVGTTQTQASCMTGWPRAERPARRVPRKRCRQDDLQPAGGRSSVVCSSHIWPTPVAGGGGVANVEVGA